MNLVGGEKRAWVVSPELDREEQRWAWELYSSFPMALLADKKLAAAGLVLAEAMAIRWREAEEGSFYAHIDRLDEPMLDTLAYDFKVDWWDETYTVEEKRRTLKNSWYVHRILGTKAAVERAIRAIYPDTDAVEWFDYGGEPFHFRLYIDLSDVMGDETRPWHVIDRVNFYKSLRSHLDEIRYTMEAKRPAVLRIGTRVGANAGIGVPEAPDVFDFRSALYTAEGMGTRGCLGLRERPDVFQFTGEVRAGTARAGEHTLLSMPENAAAPNRVSILRTGGSFVMIAPPVFPTDV